MRKQFAKTLFEVGTEDKKLVVLIGDISHFLLRNFQKEFPDRFYNMGIAEQSMVGVAAGLSLGGYIPVVHSIAPFVVERCYEQIKDDLCYQDLGVSIISVGSAFDYASLGCTHHCYEDIGCLRLLPNMQIIYPGSTEEFDTLFKQAYSNGHPKYFRLPNTTHGLITHPKFGEIERLIEGTDISIVVTGPQVANAVEAANELKSNGVSCEVLYITTLKPISKRSQLEIVSSVSKTRRLLTIEEHSINGGLADIIGSICKNVFFVHERMGISDVFLENYGSYEEHCKKLGFTKKGIIKKINELKSRNNN